MNAALTDISYGILVTGGLLVITLILLAAATLAWVAGEIAWRRAKNLYTLNRLLWGIHDLRKHGKVLPRPGIDEPGVGGPP